MSSAFGGLSLTKSLLKQRLKTLGEYLRMSLQTAAIEKVCPREEIAAYLDGEISSREELELEMHFAVCKVCGDELNTQKKLLCALDSALLNEKEIEVPEDFVKVVVARAESGVSGLRRPQERRTALLVCSILFLTALLGLGEKAGMIFAASEKFSEQFMAVGSFAAHLIYNIAVGIAVILRSLSNQFVFNSAVSAGFVVILFLLSLITVSRLIVRFNRA